MISTITRRGLAAMALVGAATFGLGASGALAQDKPTLRFATSASATENRGLGLTEYAAAIADKVTLELHFNSTLFAQGTELLALQRGNLDMALIAPQDLSKQLPEWSIFTAGYLLRDPDHMRKVFASDVGKEMFQLVEDKLGVVIVGALYQGRRQVNLKGDKEIRTPADMAGIKLRMPGAPEWLFLGEALGASPAPMAFAEVYTGLQTGTIDGQDNPLPAVFDRKFYEVTNQIVLTSHLVDISLMAISKKALDGLSAEQREAVLAEGRNALSRIGAKQEQTEAELVEFFKQQGLKVYEPDLEAFRTQVQKKYLESDYSKTWVPGMVDRVNAVQ